MFITRGLWAVGAASLAAGALACSLAEAGVEKNVDYRVRGGTADGSFERFNDCETVLVSVSAHEDLRAENGSRNVTAITIINRNRCENQTVLTYGHELYDVFSPPTKQLESAELAESTFPVTSCRFTESGEICQQSEARVTARWEANGTVSRSRYNYYQRFGDDKFSAIIRGRSSGINREATFSLSVEIDGVPMDLEQGQTYGTLNYVDSGDYRFVRTAP